MRLKKLLAVTIASLLCLPAAGFAANHREAPITALDHKADITDVYAFRSYGGTSSTPRVTLIMSVDPLLEPANGPNYFPFDADILYEIKVDNDNDAVEDVVFQFRFKTEQRLPNLFQVYAGVPGGAVAPANSPAPVAPGTLIVPPQIKTFDDPGLGLRQTYTVTWSRTASRRRSRVRRRALLRRARQPGPAHDGLRGALRPRHLLARRRTSRSSRARPTTRSGSTSAAPSTR